MQKRWFSEVAVNDNSTVTKIWDVPNLVIKKMELMPRPDKLYRSYMGHQRVVTGSLMLTSNRNAVKLIDVYSNKECHTLRRGYRQVHALTIQPQRQHQQEQAG